MLSKIKDKIAIRCIHFLYINKYITNDMFLDCSGYMIKNGKNPRYRIWNVDNFMKGDNNV